MECTLENQSKVETPRENALEGEPGTVMEGRTALTRKQIKIINQLGLHLRAAAMLVNRANQFKSEIFLKKGRILANARSIIHLVSLTARRGCKLWIICSGEDHQDAADAVERMFHDKFGELD